MTGAIVDSGTFVRVCVKCTSAAADLRGTCIGKLIVTEVSFRDRCTGVMTR